MTDRQTDRQTDKQTDKQVGANSIQIHFHKLKGKVWCLQMPTGAQECIVPFFVVVVFSWQGIRKQFTKLCAPPLASLLGISEGSSLGNYDFSVFEGQSGIVRFFSVFQLEELQREKESFLREAQNTRMSHCWEYMCHRGRCLDHCQAIRPLKINEIWTSWETGKKIVHTVLCFLSITWPISDATYLFYRN